MTDTTIGPPPWAPPESPWGASAHLDAPRAPGAPGAPLPWQVAAAWARPDRRTAIVVLAIAAAFVLAAHGRVAGVGTAILVGVVVVALLASGRVRTVGARVAALAAVPLVALLVLRSSPWLVPPVGVVTALVVLAAVSYAGGGRLRQLSLTGTAVRAGRSLLSLLGAPAYLFGSLAALVPLRDPQRRRHLVAVARGIGLALPVVVVLGALLASADVVFASTLRLPVGADEATRDAVLLVVGALLGAWLVVDASADPLDEVVLPARVLGPIETGVVLGAVAVLYAAFAGVQVVTARGGATHVLETAGLTYAGYAREGFFQLLAVAGLTLVLLLGVRAATKESARRVRIALTVLSEVVVGLTLVIVGVAIVRLGLYEQAYGLTMLRLFSTAVAWWLGAVFLIVGVACADPRRDRRWVAAALAASVVALVLIGGLADPEDVVMRHNLARAEETGRFDVFYLQTLSDDAVPALVEGLPSLAEGDRRGAIEILCARPTRGGAPIGDERTWPAWNRSTARADAAREEVCER